VAIRRVIESHRTRNARVFGSVLRGEDTDQSDLDLLVDPTPETTLFDLGAIPAELRELPAVPVDVLTPRVLPDRVRATMRDPRQQIEATFEGMNRRSGEERSQGQGSDDDLAL